MQAKKFKQRSFTNKLLINFNSLDFLRDTLQGIRPLTLKEAQPIAGTLQRKFLQIFEVSEGIMFILLKMPFLNKITKVKHIFVNYNKFFFS